MEDLMKPEMTEEMERDMKVSVYCTVYNHAKYLRSALDGFVNQVTDFDYEVFVHDDASTDESAMIIQEYAEQYPQIIKPIYQTENQYSKQVRIFDTYILPQMSGEYIAACEGDDYWCDPSKLQRQVDFLDAHSEYSACVHNTELLDMQNGKRNLMFACEEDFDIIFEDAVQSKSYHTSSLMYRKQYAVIRPDFFAKAKNFGDAPLAILLTWNGKVRFLNRVMSVYRHGTVGSWSFRNECDMESRAQSYRNYAAMLRSVNDYTDYSKKALIDYWVTFYELNAFSFEGNKRQFREEPYHSVFKGLPFRSKCSIIARLYFKPLYIARIKLKKYSYTLSKQR